MVNFSSGAYPVDCLRILCELFADTYGKTMPEERYDRVLIAKLIEDRMIQVINGRAMLTVSGWELVCSFLKIMYAFKS